MVNRLARYAAAFVAASLALIFLAFNHQELLLAAPTLLRLFDENPVVLALSLYFLVFLAIVTLRYLLLLLFSFLEHWEDLSGAAHDEDEPGPDPRSAPLISVIVPAYNEGKVIQGAIASLLELDYPRFEVLVVDDGSTDDTYERACEMVQQTQHCDIRVLTKPNGGKADALNVGIASARGEFVVTMDGDTKLGRDVLRLCQRHFSDTRVGAVAGNVKVLNRENLLTRMQALEYVEGLAMARKAQSYMRLVNIVPGPLGMFRRTALVQAGGYDSDTFAEDCDLTLKLLMHGWHIVYEPRAVALAESPSRLLDLLKQRYRWTRGILQAIFKHRSSLFRFSSSGVNFFILWYMLFEAVLWPVSNVLGNAFFAYVGLQYGATHFLFYWWLQLVLLDVVAAAYCVILEREEFSLILMAPLFRIFFILVVDVAKLFATLEQWAGLSMTWGKLEREGKL